MLKYLLFITFFLSTFVFASEHQMINSLGSSAKGQYVALEEYGYHLHSHTYYVRIKIMNVWKEEYVGRPVEVKVPAHRPQFLKKARAKARIMAQEDFLKFGISA